RVEALRDERVRLLVRLDLALILADDGRLDAVLLAFLPHHTGELVEELRGEGDRDPVLLPLEGRVGLLARELDRGRRGCGGAARAGGTGGHGRAGGARSRAAAVLEQPAPVAPELALPAHLTSFRAGVAARRLSTALARLGALPDPGSIRIWPAVSVMKR